MSSKTIFPLPTTTLYPKDFLCLIYPWGETFRISWTLSQRRVNEELKAEDPKLQLKRRGYTKQVRILFQAASPKVIPSRRSKNLSLHRGGQVPMSHTGQKSDRDKACCPSQAAAQPRAMPPDGDEPLQQCGPTPRRWRPMRCRSCRGTLSLPFLMQWKVSS